uniref:Uncharacterized protein n=1 Tax=Tetranychus urticae TaxID=32264 RepID=T1KWJ7_TETUR
MGFMCHENINKMLNSLLING